MQAATGDGVARARMGAHTNYFPSSSRLMAAITQWPVSKLPKIGARRSFSGEMAGEHDRPPSVAAADQGRVLLSDGAKKFGRSESELKKLRSHIGFYRGVHYTGCSAVIFQPPHQL